MRPFSSSCSGLPDGPVKGSTRQALNEDMITAVMYLTVIL